MTKKGLTQEQIEAVLDPRPQNPHPLKNRIEDTKIPLHRWTRLLPKCGKGGNPLAPSTLCRMLRGQTPMPAEIEEDLSGALFAIEKFQAKQQGAS
jgi:hypothetical protein